MFLAVDVGNTNIVLGGFNGDNLEFVSRIQTLPNKMADEYKITIESVLDINGYKKENFDGAMISCVVPQLITPLKQALTELFETKVYLISAGVKTGLNIKIENPVSLGADLVAGAVSAMNRYPLPCIIIDLGTATKFYLVDENKSFLGGSIAPGVKISLDALSSKTAMLPHIDFDNTKNVIGKNSIDCMKSGVIFGSASMIDGMLERMIEEYGEVASVVATGGIAPLILPYCKTKIEVNENLLLLGIKDVFDKMNSPK